MTNVLVRMKYKSKCEALVAWLAQLEAALYAIDEADLCLGVAEAGVLEAELRGIRTAVDEIALPAELVSAADAIGDAAHLGIKALDGARADFVVRQNLEGLKDIGKLEAPAIETAVVRISPSDYETAVNYTVRALESLRYLATLYKVDITPALVKGGLYLT